jgi:hypothetical protein
MRSRHTAYLAENLRDYLGERFVVVERPEHPYLISPPDLLIGGEGLLTAVFLPKAAESRMPRLLYARLVAARLALSERTRCALVFTTEFVHRASFAPEAQRDFEIVLSIDEPHKLAALVASDKIRMQRKAELTEIKMHNAERSSRALVLSKIAEHFDRVHRDREDYSFDEIGFVLSRLSAEGPALSSPIMYEQVVHTRAKWLLQFHRGQQLLMLARMSGRRDALSRAVQTTLHDQYTLDTGVPYPRTDAMPIVFPDRQPEAGPRREFLTRAASLAGLIIGPGGAPRQIEKFIALEETARQRRLKRAELADWLRA